MKTLRFAITSILAFLGFMGVLFTAALTALSWAVWQGYFDFVYNRMTTDSLFAGEIQLSRQIAIFPYKEIALVLFVIGLLMLSGMMIDILVLRNRE